MNSKIGIFCAIAIGLLLSQQAESQQGSLPKGHPPLDGQATYDSQGAPASNSDVTGTVLETMDAASYTYVHVDAGARSVWAAAPKFPVKVGDRVSVPTTSPMQNYRSDTLDRTFPLVYFAGKIRVAGAGTNVAMASDMNTPHPTSSRAAPVSEQALAGITKAEGGRTVGELFDQGKGLAGSEVLIRGRVVKYSPGIMGKNWLHVQDGTQGKDGSNDLVITTDGEAAVGDRVLVRGVVSANKDFGYGYTYEVMVESAQVTVE